MPQSAGPEALAAAVAEAEAKLGPEVRRLHYLSVPPKAARAVITMLRDANLVDRSRVVMEKPFGTDLASAVELNAFVHETFRESQIFRIDHFLGKEAAQNILAFRFANGLFEPIWNRNFIDHIQIDIPETLGLDERANFYESTGAYKDMVVTHLFQVMAFVVMEPPTALEPRAISEEKNKVFRSMLPVDPANVVRGQYVGYRENEGVARDSDTETFIALKVGIDNWRWAGVPVYLRTGKRMAEGIRIISIAFKEAPRSMFPPGSGVGSQGPDHLTFDLADNSKVSLSFYGKRPGPGMKLDKLSMQFSTQEIDTVTRRVGGLRATDPGRDARRPHAVHHGRGYRVAVGAIGRPVGQPSAGQDLPAGNVGTQRDPSADRAQRVAAPVRARVARGQEIGRAIRLVGSTGSSDPVQPPIRLTVTVIGYLELQRRNVGTRLVEGRVSLVQRVGEPATRGWDRQQVLDAVRRRVVEQPHEIRVRGHHERRWLLRRRDHREPIDGVGDHRTLRKVEAVEVGGDLTLGEKVAAILRSTALRG